MAMKPRKPATVDHAALVRQFFGNNIQPGVTPNAASLPLSAPIRPEAFVAQPAPFAAQPAPIEIRMPRRRKRVPGLSIEGMV